MVLPSNSSINGETMSMKTVLNYAMKYGTKSYKF